MSAPSADRNWVRCSACFNMEDSARDHHPEFLLARLQKLQRSKGIALSGCEWLTEVS
jgi:hypothetical protein